ncbi:MAG: bifunctional precorrin-2 dehydrogenase/sirohydrochlorin ferrochelatase [Candidatus Nezhaarchaeales archaeon]
MSKLPLLIDLNGRFVVVIGGGGVARRKIETLLSYGAKVIVYEPNPSQELLSLSEKGVEVIRKEVGIEDVEEIASRAHIVIVATNNVDLNRRIGEFLRSKGVLVNVATSYEISTVVFPAILRLGDVVIAISTSGLSPFLASYIKDKVKRSLGDEIGAIAEVLGYVRNELKKRTIQMKVKRAIYKALLSDNEIVSLIAQGLKDKAKERALEKSLKYIEEQAKAV